MRLRNIPGAQDAILESPYVIQQPESHKGSWENVFEKKQPIHHDFHGIDRNTETGHRR